MRGAVWKFIFQYWKGNYLLDCPPSGVILEHLRYSFRMLHHLLIPGSPCEQQFTPCLSRLLTYLGAPITTRTKLLPTADHVQQQGIQNGIGLADACRQGIHCHVFFSNLKNESYQIVELIGYGARKKWDLIFTQKICGAYEFFSCESSVDAWHSACKILIMNSGNSIALSSTCMGTKFDLYTPSIPANGRWAYFASNTWS